MLHHLSFHHYRLALVLLVSDLSGLAMSFSIVYALFNRSMAPQELLGLIASAIIILFSLYLTESYEIYTQILGLRAPYRAILSNAAAFIIILFFAYVLNRYWSELLQIDPAFIIGLVFFTAWASISRVFFASFAFSQALEANWLFMGGKEFYSTTWKDLINATKFHSTATEKSRLDVIMPLTESILLNDIPLDKYSGIVIGDIEDLEEDVIQGLMKLRLSGVLVYSLPNFCESFLYKIPPIYLKDDWFVFSSGFSLFYSYTRSRFKRFLDLVVSLGLLMLFSPMMILTGVLIRLDSRGSILYSQIRSGLNGKIFRLYKFRSMSHNAEVGKAQWAAVNDPRVTRIGRILRLTRVDELPQLFNVLIGDMSLIGPRPERPEFDQILSAKIPYYDIRYLVKPGITGWAQVMYPYGASIEDAYQKLAFDLYYIKNYSFMLDVAILLKTVRVVLLGRGR